MKKHIILFALLCMTLETMQAREISSVIKKPVNLLTHILENRITNKEDCYFNNQELPNVKVYWGNSLPRVDIIEAFETGDFCMFDWQLDGSYPWSVTTTNPYEGTYCMKSGGAGVPNVVSNMTVTVNIPANGQMSFYSKISCENNWDHGYFYIDGVQKGIFTGVTNWGEMTYDITAGNHTFQWRYTKDGSGNSNDDCLYVDYICFYRNTEPIVIPTVTTFQVTNIQQTTATGGGSVTSDGGASVTERGICWSTSHNPTTNGSHASNGTGPGSFTVNMTGLTPGTTYYVRAYATNSAGTAYGSEVSFTTNSAVTLPTVTTAQVTNIQQTTATGGGNVTNAGGGTVTERGICWSTSHNPTTNGSHASSGSGTGSFTVNITGLTAGTTYYVRAYATNSAGTAYGSEVSFTTLPNVNLPTVTTAQVTNIQQTTATGGGNVTNAGGGAVTERGICWSTSHNPTTNGSHASSGSGTGSFSVNMTGLTPGTTYYVRAYATNSAGTAYGSEVSFTTLSAVNLPTVTTAQVTNIQQTTATGGGNVTSDGGALVTERGVCWSTTHNPTVSNAHTSDGTGTGQFTSSITGLSPNTTYYVRAYATNSAGTSYGNEVTFTTSQEITIPTVITSQVTNISETSATGGGNVTSDGGAPVTERGICWSTSNNPDIDGSHLAANSGGIGEYSVYMTDLTPNKTYYVRAYAINSKGTAYGDEVYFITDSQLPYYDIIVKADPINGGTVTGGASYQQGQSCTLTATPALGYEFTIWTKNDDPSPVSTNASFSFPVTESATYVAHFKLQEFIITTMAEPVNGGTVNGGGSYHYNDSTTLSAQPYSGFVFDHWNDGDTQNPRTITVTQNMTFIAYFIEDSGTTYSIQTEAEPSEGGTVTVDQNEATPGAIITITVNADDGYELETLSVYKTNDPSQQVTVTNNQFSMPAYNVTVMAKFKQIGIHIDTPDPICAGESLDLTEPSIPWLFHGEWQLSETYEFEQPIPYTTGQPLEANYNGWYLRYHAYNLIGNIYSNRVQITVRSLDGFVLQGNTSANLNQEVEYQVYIDGVDDYADYSFNWSVSDAQAVTTITANSLKVIWKTIGEHQVSVTITDNIAGCTDTFSTNVTVTGCIENIQAIQPKYHKEDYEYILILVYPNVDNEGNPSNEEYDYQWLYSPDGVQDYLDLDEGTSKNQYYYIGGPLKDGYYKVRINRKGEDECFGETEAYPVFNNRQLRIYPNPSRRGSEITVMNDCNGPALLTIYSTDGRVLHTQTVTDSQATIGISLPQGVYVAYLTNRDGYTKVGKLIIH